MKFRINELDLVFKKGKESIAFEDFSYFYGQMGAGKSTIARLIDFCLAGNLTETEMTPALQSEFVSSGLSLEIEGSPLYLRRDAGSNLIRASWTQEEEPVEVMIPARKADGEVIEGTGIEVLSDLIYALSGKTPPKVRKSKIKDDSELTRLSLRDLLWYCYLDQDSMDSSFFNLERDGDSAKRLKSRDVLRFIIGFYQEQVSELEVKLELCRQGRLKSEAGATAIKEALSESDIATQGELDEQKRRIEQQISAVESSIKDFREKVNELKPHAMESLQEKARVLSEQVADLELASVEIKDTISKDKTHKNELLALSTRFRRSQSAREVLSGVSFKDCPSCGKELPESEENVCNVCGQVHTDTTTGVLDEIAAERDLDARVSELTELISRQEAALRNIERNLRETKAAKASVDLELNRVAVEYDSAYLSVALETEKQRAALRQQLLDFCRIETLIQKIGKLSARVSDLLAEEHLLREELKKVREKAEQDTHNLDRLKALFLDCLVRAKLSGFYQDDIVNMESPFFLPEISSAGIGDLAVTSFSNLGSGGKKTLFKCCFALAIHRLAVELNALLPTLIIIDSPMKNISERENREQFEGFFELLYELSATELKGTQLILIDKELCSPPDDFDPSFLERHMKPNERDVDPIDNPYPPLIRYYQGK